MIVTLNLFHVPLTNEDKLIFVLRRKFVDLVRRIQNGYYDDLNNFIQMKSMKPYLTILLRKNYIKSLSIQETFSTKNSIQETSQNNHTTVEKSSKSSHQIIE